MIEIKHLSKTFQMKDGAVNALSDINLTIPDGSIYGIIGMSGAGKSTLVRCINLLERPTEGSVVIDGVEMETLSPAELRARRREITMIFQQFNLLMQRSCLKNICFPMELAGVKKADAEKRARELLEMVGLPDKANAYPAQLSGGQKRRVAEAGVMAMKPRILVLDEPAAGLDPEGRDEILSEVKNYHKKTGTTVLLVSHSMEDIAKYANRVLVMSNKKIAMYDTVENVFARASELLELGLSVPQVTKIFLKLREMGVDVPADVYTIPYAVKTLLEAKRRRDAGESLVLPRSAAQKGGAV